MSNPENTSFWIKTEDWHTSGEPFRIVPNLPPTHPPPNEETVSLRRLAILRTPDHPLDVLREALCHEPRGHADMYGGFIVPPNDPGAHFGVLFFHKDGFSTACGHGTLALGRWAVESGIVGGVREGSVKVVVDVPSGRVVADVMFTDGIVQHVDFVNVASYQFAKDLPVDVAFEGKLLKLSVDLSWGGATYASVPASDLGLKVEPESHQIFIDLARKIKAELGSTADHCDTSLYGVCFFETLHNDDETLVQKNVVVFADGQIDRSPCGSGTCARVAVLLANGGITVSKKLVHRSIIDTVFEARISKQEDELNSFGFPICYPVVRGNAALTGRHEFYIAPTDPTYPGFLLR